MTTERVVSRRLSPERWRTLEPLVDSALELSGRRREKFLDEVCQGDVALRGELTWMVSECSRSDPSLDQPAIERFASLLEDESAPESTLPIILADRFRLDRELGRGGMATVYLAWDLKHARDVAVKMVPPEAAAAIGGERFLSEIHVTATLRHPHILPLFDSGEADGFIYFVMPYIEGGTLRDRLKHERPLNKIDALRIAGQVADGLASAHERGIIHRDIKPENILLAAGGRHAYVADFGIALAMSRVGARASRSGPRMGTPAYMSPEQLARSAELDARSDVYSLGCVLHEMLWGAPPRPPLLITSRFQLLAHRCRQVRRRITTGALERMVGRTLADSPDDRFQTATALSQQLTLASRKYASAREKRKWLAGGAATAALVMSLAVTTSATVRQTIRGWLDRDIDPELTVVVPFQDRSSSAVLSGANAARLLYDALGQWKDLKLGDEMSAVDAGRRSPNPIASVADAATIAHSLGAGRFVWGEVRNAGGSTRIDAQLYDARHPTQPVTHSVLLTSANDAAAKIQEIADSLVAKLVGTPAASAATRGTRVFPALKRYADGYAALRDWNTELATQEFRAAVELDPHFPQAWLGIAQSMAWSGLHQPPEWLDPASRALLDSNALGPRDRLLARGLAALAEWRMADACDVYRRLIARDPRDFAAHFGLGDCLSRDRVVIRDRSSPTSWRFRGSLQTAIQEYLRALELVPSYLEGSRGQTFGSLTNRILFDDPSMVRLGFALTPDTIWMGAYPEIQNDTLAFYPRPRAQFIATGEPATHRDAVARNRDQLRVLSERWVRLFPQSSAAWEHYAKALESVGILDTLDVTRRGPGALGAVDRAIRLAGADTLARLTQEATRVRVLLKLRRFAAAQASAESAIASRPSRSAGDAAVLAPLAALTGRARLTSTLLAIAATDSNNELFSDRHGGGRVLPVPVMTAAGAFAGYAAFGAPADSLRATRDRLERTIRNSVGVTSRDAVRSTVFLPWSFQAEPTLGTSLLLTVHDARERLLVPWQSLGRNDPAAARQTVAREAERIRASDFLPAPDVSLQFALLALAVGDTSAARLVLDHVIAALPELSTRLTTEVNPAAALPRVLALRAQLARRDETGAIATWAAARPLWLRADPEVLAAFDVLGVSRGVR